MDKKYSYAEALKRNTKLLFNKGLWLEPMKHVAGIGELLILLSLAPSNRLIANSNI